MMLKSSTVVWPGWSYFLDGGPVLSRFELFFFDAASLACFAAAASAFENPALACTT